MSQPVRAAVENTIAKINTFIVFHEIENYFHGDTLYVWLQRTSKLTNVVGTLQHLNYLTSLESDIDNYFLEILSPFNFLVPLNLSGHFWYAMAEPSANGEAVGRENTAGNCHENSWPLPQPKGKRVADKTREGLH